MKKIFLLFVGIFFLCMGSVQATNITISDKNPPSAATGWYGSQEDDEVEPGMETGQKWDLEGFFVNGTKLSLVGGYDFKNGATGSGHLFSSGDIFIDVDGTPVYGDIHGTKNGNYSVKNTFGYDYVLDLDWTTGQYNVYAIDGQSTVLTAYYSQNQGSSPWQYVPPQGSESLFTGAIEYHQYGKNKNFYGTTFGGDWHNELIIDLAFLPGLEQKDKVSFFAHYTMGCGNDNLMGKGVIPNPEPATMLLLGFGLISIAGLGRRKLT